MKRYRVICVMLLGLVPAIASSQEFGYWPQNQGALMGGLGVTSIDDTTYLTINLRPELAFGHWGLGLEIPLRFNTNTGNLRHADWDEGYDYLRIIRYLRYGKKHDPLFFRIGALDAARIGHGFIMNFYNNDFVNYDRRKIGLSLDLDAGVAGFESMTSNLTRAELFGGRVYYRPMYEMALPILHLFAVGASFVTDTDPDERRATSDDVSEFGLDVELPIIKTSLFQTLLYADYAKFSGYGSGKALGVEVTLSGVANSFEFVAQLERRFLAKRFLPAYFNAFYEFEKFQVHNGVPSRKEDLLAAQQQKTKGTFGLLYGSILNTLTLTGTYERLDRVPKSGLLHIQAQIPDAVPKVSARANYTRFGIDSFSDAFQLDDRSIARFGLGYKIYPFMIFYMDYIWTYRRNPATEKFEVQKRFEPQVVFVYPFNVGKR